MSNTIDSKINALFEKVKQDKQNLVELEAKAKRGWVTMATICLDGQSRSVNIQTASKEKIVEVMAFLIAKQEQQAKAHQMLELPEEPFEHQGYTLEQWNTDLKTRLFRIKLKQDKEALDQAEARLRSILSDDKKREVEFEDILKNLD